jgi:hypothetical protein
MSVSPGGCAQEASTPPGASSPVNNCETVVHFVRPALWLGWNAHGNPHLLPTAIRREDIEAKKPGKSVSVYWVGAGQILAAWVAGPLRAFSRRGAKLNRGVELSPAYIDVA